MTHFERVCFRVNELLKDAELEDLAEEAAMENGIGHGPNASDQEEQEAHEQLHIACHRLITRALLLSAAMRLS